MKIFSYSLFNTGPMSKIKLGLGFTSGDVSECLAEIACEDDSMYSNDWVIEVDDSINRVDLENKIQKFLKSKGYSIDDNGFFVHDNYIIQESAVFISKFIEDSYNIIALPVLIEYGRNIPYTKNDVDSLFAEYTD